MIRTINWIERQFKFDFHPGVFPCIVERLRGTPARLEEKISQIPEILIRKNLNNKWSILEHAGHLLDLESLDEIRLKEFLSGKKELSSADISNRATTEKNYNAKTKKEILVNFRNKRYNFVEKIKNLTEDEIQIVSIHPRLKINMRLVDWLYFIAEHDDHHLAKIDEIYREIS